MWDGSAHMLIQCCVTCVGFRHVLKKTLSTWLTILIYPIYQKRFDGLSFKVSCIVVWFLYATDLYIFSTHGTVQVLLIANAMLSPEKNNILPTDVYEKRNTRKRKAETAVTKPSSKSAKLDSVSSHSSTASSLDWSSDRWPTVLSGASGLDPSNTNVVES